MATSDPHMSYLNAFAMSTQAGRQFAAGELMREPPQTKGGGQLELLKMIREVDKISGQRSGKGVNPASVLQLISSLRRTKGDLIKEKSKQIADQAAKLYEASQKNKALLDWRAKTHRNVEGIISRMGGQVEQRVMTVDEDKQRGLSAKLWLHSVTTILGHDHVKGKDEVTQRALMADLARMAKIAAQKNPIHEAGYQAISDKYFGSRDPVQAIRDDYPIYTPEGARKAAESFVVPGVSDVDNELRSARLLANKEFGYALAEGEEIPPDMMAKAEQQQGGEFDALKKQLIAQYMMQYGGGVGGVGGVPGAPGVPRGVRANQAHMILSNMMAAPPLLGGSPVGASSKLLRLAYSSRKSMAEAEQARIAFETRFGYAPGTRGWERVQRAAPVAAKKEEERQEMRQVTTGPGGGNLYDFAHDRLNLAQGLLQADTPEGRKQGYDIAYRTAELLETVTGYDQHDRMLGGLGFEGSEGYDDFWMDLWNTGSPDEDEDAVGVAKKYVEGMLPKLNEALGDPKRRSLGEVGDVYSDMFDWAVKAGDRVHFESSWENAEQVQGYVENYVQKMEQFVASLPPEMQGDVGKEFLRLTKGFREIDRKDQKAVIEGVKFLHQAVGSLSEGLDEEGPLSVARQELALQASTELGVEEGGGVSTQWDTKVAELERALEGAKVETTEANRNLAGVQAFLKQHEATDATQLELRDKVKRKDKADQAVAELYSRIGDLREDASKVDELKGLLQRHKDSHDKQWVQVTNARDVYVDEHATDPFGLGELPERFPEEGGEPVEPVEPLSTEEKSQVSGKAFQQSVASGELPPRFAEWVNNRPSARTAIYQWGLTKDRLADTTRSYDASVKAAEQVSKNRKLIEQLTGEIQGIEDTLADLKSHGIQLSLRPKPEIDADARIAAAQTRVDQAEANQERIEMGLDRASRTIKEFSIPAPEPKPESGPDILGEVLTDPIPTPI